MRSLLAAAVLLCSSLAHATGGTVDHHGNLLTEDGEADRLTANERCRRTAAGISSRPRPRSSSACNDELGLPQQVLRVELPFMARPAAR